MTILPNGYLFAETRGVMLSEWTYNHVSLSSNDQNPDLGYPLSGSKYKTDTKKHAESPSLELSQIF